MYDIAAGGYVAAFASPDCSTYSKLQNLPGPPLVRGASGSDLDGSESNSTKQKEYVRLHTLISVRVAKPVDMLTARPIPLIFVTPAIHPGQVSMAALGRFHRACATDGRRAQEWRTMPISVSVIKIYFLGFLLDQHGRYAHDLQAYEAFVVQRSNRSRNHPEAHTDDGQGHI